MDAIYVNDEQGHFVDCNSQACQLLGYTREELLSMSFKDVSRNMLTEEEMEVVGEGIESASQYTRLQVLACEMVQGDYFSEPLPVEAANALITKDTR